MSTNDKNAHEQKDNSSSEEFVQSDFGKFYIEAQEDGNYLMNYKEDNSDTVSSKVIDGVFNFLKFRRFVRENMIDLGSRNNKEMYDEICKLKKLIKLNKENTINPIDSFFEDSELLENNQLVIDEQLAYTMCNGYNTILVTYEKGFEFIDEDDRFRKYPKMKSNLLTKRGKQKLESKLVNENIFNDLKQLLLKYAELPESDLNIVLFYIFHSYLHNIQGSTVYLYFTGMPGTGKSSILKFLKLVTWNGQYVCNLSASSLFREVHVLQPTLNIDEIDKVGQDMYSSIQGLIHSGYSKGGVVKRTERTTLGNFVPTEFRVFCPKTFTSNSPIFVDSFKSRCIQIIPQKTSRFIYPIDILSKEDLDTFSDIRDDIYIYMLKYGMDIFDIFKDEIENPQRISTRKNQLISVLNCFNKHFNVNMDIEKALQKKEEFTHPFQDHYFLILEILAENIKDGYCTIRPSDLAKKMNYKLEGENLLRHHVTSISAGMKMTNLGFSEFKRLNTSHGYHYDIPMERIKRAIMINGFDIQIPE